MRPETEERKRQAQARIARWNVLSVLEEPGPKAALALLFESHIREQEKASREIALIDEISPGADAQTLALKIMLRHARWIASREVAGMLDRRKQEYREAVRFLEDLERQDKEQ